MDLAVEITPERDAICEAEIRRPFPRPIEDQQLLLEEHRFRDQRTRAAGTGKSGDCRQQMEDENGEVAHAPVGGRATDAIDFAAERNLPV